MSSSGAERHSGQSPELIRETGAVLDVAMYVVDAHGLIIDVNSQAEKLLARSAEELVGQDAHDLLRRNSRGETMPRAQCLLMQAFLSNRTAHGTQDWFERGDGSLLELAWTVTPCRVGEEARGAVVLFHKEQPDTSTSAPGRDGRPTAPLTELDRLALLAETTTTLTSTLDVDDALDRLVRLVVPLLADWAVIDLFTGGGDVRRTAVLHYEEGALVRKEGLEGPMPPVPEESSMPLCRALRGGSATVAGPRTYHGPPDSGVAVVQRELFEATGIHSAAIAPIRGPREVLGALTLGRADRAGHFDAGELSLLEDITRRAGLALSNAHLYQQQRRVSETMQRHLLPQLPSVTGVQMAARYLAAPNASQVGGDWYDAFVLPDGPTALVIGDVVGHDLDAAAGMAQVRNMLRALAWSHQERPAAIVERLDRALLHLTDISMATVVFAHVEGTDDGQWLLRWTNAGHPPPLLVASDGEARFLEYGHGILLGTGMAPERSDAVITLPPRSTVVFYTDGLVESPGESIDVGLAKLRRSAVPLAQRPLSSFCDRLLDRVRSDDNGDDVALLAFRVPAAPEHGPEAAPAPAT
ncbi:SpoIIE family protein phosphatase [Streptomyces ovatisporus]|uniref:SpoIIE family protein phosphatase n=1 Tax=Streptomyces ovatisporus TaxID=1128682 RepID=A0ABV9A6B1_9ACTN